MDWLNKLKYELKKSSAVSECFFGTTQDYENLLQYLEERWRIFINPKLNREEFINGVKKIIEENFLINNGNNTKLSIYKMLFFVFQNTNSMQRQEHFHELCSYYCQNEISWMEFNKQINTVLPLVKVNSLQSALNSERINQEVNDLAWEVYECVKCVGILREDCYEILSKQLSETTWKLLDFDLDPIEGSSGTLGEYYTLNVTVKADNRIEHFQYFAKYLPSPEKVNPDQFRLASISFKKEEFFYGTFIEELKNLGFNDILNFAPKYYFSRTDYVLVLEDLTPLGYKTSDIAKPATFQWLIHTVKNLAQLHACSFLLEEVKSKSTGEIYRLDQDYEEYLKETLVFKENRIYDNSAETYINFFFNQFSFVCKDMSLDEFKRRARIVFDSIYTSVQKSHKYRNVICHGDIWASNILYKGESQEEATSCYLIDFQLIKYCSPAWDLLVLIYTHTTRVARKEYFNSLLDIYYCTLTDVLCKYDVDVNEFFPKESFERCCEDAKEGALCAASLFVQLFICPPHISPLRTDDPVLKSNFLLFDRSEVFSKALKYDFYQNRVLEFVEDIYEICKNKGN